MTSVAKLKKTLKQSFEQQCFTEYQQLIQRDHPRLLTSLQNAPAGFWHPAFEAELVKLAFDWHEEHGSKKTIQALKYICQKLGLNTESVLHLAMTQFGWNVEE